MSCDSKVWLDDEGWHAIHDGECRADAPPHDGTYYDLVEVLQSVEACRGATMAWGIRQYSNGQVGLVGYESAAGPVS